MDKSILDKYNKCDSCSARAQSAAEFSTGVLYFCGHHWRKNRSAIISTTDSYYVTPEQDDFVKDKEDESCLTSTS